MDMYSGVCRMFDLYHCLGKFSRWQFDDFFFFLFSPGNRLWHFLQICMKCQCLFSGKNKKFISKCYLLQVSLSMLSVILWQRMIEWMNEWVSELGMVGRGRGGGRNGSETYVCLLLICTVTTGWIHITACLCCCWPKVKAKDWKNCI